MFAFDLALALGKKDPDAMLASMPLATLYDWMEYANRKPFGDERADLRIALMASAFVNTQLVKGARPIRPIDFMPFSKGHTQRNKQTPDQMRMMLKGIAQLHKQKADQIAAKQPPQSP